MAPPADAILAFGSAIPLVVLGVLLVSIRPRRYRQVFFGAFAILWGLQIAAANWGRLVEDAQTHLLFLRVSLTIMVPMYLILTHFAVRRHRHTWGWMVTGALGIFASAAFVVFLVDPSLFVRDVTMGALGLRTSFGPFFGLLINLPFFSSFIVAIIVLYHDYRRARAGTPRRRTRGILMALALYASYQFMRATAVTTDLLVGQGQFASGSIRLVGDINSAIITATFLIGTIILIGIAAHIFLRPPPPEDRDLPLFLAFVSPALVAILETYLNHAGIPMDMVGFWRLVAVAVLVYTLANYQLFDLELRLKRLAGPGVAALIGVFGVPVAISMSLGDFGTRAVIMTMIPEVVAMGGAVVFRSRIEQSLFSGVKEGDDYAHRRRLELYKVALEDVLERGEDPDHPRLSRMRDDYGIGSNEHQVLVWMAKSEQGPVGQSTEVELRPGQTVLERYDIIEELGQGTARMSYIARDNVSKRLVVVKMVATHSLDGIAKRALLREARLGATISHPNVVAIYDVAEEPARTLIVMDYADKGNLEDLIERDGPMPLQEANRFLDELLSGLDALHAHRIVHRNLKPKNILFDADGTVLISDLSAAHADDAAASDDASGPSGTHQIFQESAYLAPEQITDGAVGPQADLYVAAVLYYQALTGHYYLPIHGKDDAQIRTLIDNQQPQLRDERLPDWAGLILAKALAKAADDRFADARAMRSALREHAGLPRRRGVRD